MRPSSFVAVLAALVVVVGCGSTQPTPNGGSATPVLSTPSAVASVAPPSSADAGAIAWQAAGDFQVASLQVPRDYRDPSGPTIQLLLAKRPAGDPAHRIGTLLVDPGGPGGSGAGMVRYGAIEALPKAVLDSFDIVGWDPRGTPGGCSTCAPQGVAATTAVECPDTATAERIAALDPAPTTAAGFQAYVDIDRSVAAQCAAASGPLLPFLSSDDTARDMDRIRAALGEEKISYYGVSYGTYLGARYATLFPDHLRAAVLDGAFDPGGDALAIDTAQAGGFESALDHFLAACKADVKCAFHGGGDPAAAFDKLMAGVRQAPIKTSGRVPLGPAEAWNGILGFLYGPFNPLAHALADAEHGDGDALLKEAGGDVAPDLPNSWGAGLAIGCLDRPWPANAAAVEASYQAELKAAPRVGASIVLDFGCLDWPVPYVPLPPTKGVGLPPIVVLGSTGDPATPYAETARLAAALGSGVVLTRVGIGHSALDGGLNDCLVQAVQHYLVDLVPPRAGTTCPDGPIVFTK